MRPAPIRKVQHADLAWFTVNCNEGRADSVLEPRSQRLEAGRTDPARYLTNRRQRYTAEGLLGIVGEGTLRVGVDGGLDFLLFLEEGWVVGVVFEHDVEEVEGGAVLFAGVELANAFFVDSLELFL